MRIRHTIEVCTLQKTSVVVLKLIASDWLVKIELYVGRLGQLTLMLFYQFPSQNITLVTLILLLGKPARFVESDDGKVCCRGKWKVRRIMVRDDVELAPTGPAFSSHDNKYITTSTHGAILIEHHSHAL